MSKSSRLLELLPKINHEDDSWKLFEHKNYLVAKNYVMWGGIKIRFIATYRSNKMFSICPSCNGTGKISIKSIADVNNRSAFLMKLQLMDTKKVIILNHTHIKCWTCFGHLLLEMPEFSLLKVVVSNSPYNDVVSRYLHKKLLLPINMGMGSYINIPTNTSIQINGE